DLQTAGQPVTHFTSDGANHKKAGHFTFPVFWRMSLKGLHNSEPTNLPSLSARSWQPAIYIVAPICHGTNS
ncbi:MAG: hypothetical protein VYC20_05240, partial [Pseudomonadota bacterium]|nr:hypothetical protein [Pseudomonadota bacterium]